MTTTYLDAIGIGLPHRRIVIASGEKLGDIIWSRRPDECLRLRMVELVDSYECKNRPWVPVRFFQFKVLDSTLGRFPLYHFSVFRQA